MLMVGMVVAGIGLVVGLFGKGWIVCFVGVGCGVVGIIIGQAAEVALTNEMKNMVESVTAKQAHDLAVRHLKAIGDDVDDTEVFLGKFIGEMDWKAKHPNHDT
jgi:hypothetical protein